MFCTVLFIYFRMSMNKGPRIENMIRTQDGWTFNYY